MCIRDSARTRACARAHTHTHTHSLYCLTLTAWSALKCIVALSLCEAWNFSTCPWIICLPFIIYHLHLSFLVYILSIVIQINFYVPVSNNFIILDLRFNLNEHAICSSEEDHFHCFNFFSCFWFTVASILFHMSVFFPKFFSRSSF